MPEWDRGQSLAKAIYRNSRITPEDYYSKHPGGSHRSLHMDIEKVPRKVPNWLCYRLSIPPPASCTPPPPGRVEPAPVGAILCTLPDIACVTAFSIPETRGSPWRKSWQIKRGDFGYGLVS